MLHVSKLAVHLLCNNKLTNLIAMLSNKWNNNDNVYVLNRKSNTEDVNNEIKVDSNIVDYALNHTRKETLLYNNRMFAFYINPSEQRRN